VRQGLFLDVEVKTVLDPGHRMRFLNFASINTDDIKHILVLCLVHKHELLLVYCSTQSQSVITSRTRFILAEAGLMLRLRRPLNGLDRFCHRGIHRLMGTLDGLSFWQGILWFPYALFYTGLFLFHLFLNNLKIYNYL
jgi:hypothetical protein